MSVGFRPPPPPLLSYRLDSSSVDSPESHREKRRAFSQYGATRAYGHTHSTLRGNRRPMLVGTKPSRRTPGGELQLRSISAEILLNNGTPHVNSCQFFCHSLPPLPSPLPLSRLFFPATRRAQSGREGSRADAQGGEAREQEAHRQGQEEEAVQQEVRGEAGRRRHRRRGGKEEGTKLQPVNVAVNTCGFFLTRLAHTFVKEIASIKRFLSTVYTVGRLDDIQSLFNCAQMLRDDVDGGRRSIRSSSCP